jgi:hypothetical protein
VLSGTIRRLYMELNNEVVHYMPDYDLLSEDTDLSCDGFHSSESQRRRTHTS